MKLSNLLLASLASTCFYNCKMNEEEHKKSTSSTKNEVSVKQTQEESEKEKLKQDSIAESEKPCTACGMG